MTIEHLWNLGFTIGLGLISFFLREMHQGLKEQQKEQNAKISELEKNFAQFREEMPLRYVLRDDFLRAVSGLDNRIDSGFKEISKQIQSLLKGG